MNTQRSMNGTTRSGLFISLVVASSWTAGLAAVPSTTTQAASAAVTNRNTRYVNGSYTAIGQYGGLPSSITVTVTLKEGIITAVKVKTHATNPTSLDLQRRFAAAVPAVVVGKPIDTVKVGRLAGSSGTPDGFNAAIAKIKAQAAK
jgi:uncharacterized protein with FMN-binding domain